MSREHPSTGSGSPDGERASSFAKATADKEVKGRATANGEGSREKRLEYRESPSKAMPEAGNRGKSQGWLAATFRLGEPRVERE